ncbi:MAG: AMP-binding protein [Firmicutes bacterium]|nr:AMP-binding protein [Bacillota bacterium]
MNELIERIKKTAEAHPDRVAYRVGGESLTYRELVELADCYAALLRRQGTSPVIIYGHNSIADLVSIMACITAGRTYVPVDDLTPLYRVGQIIGLTGSSLVLTDRGLSIDSAECLRLDELDRYGDQDITESSDDIAYMIFTSGSTGTPKGVPITEDNLINFIDWISGLEPLRDYKDVNVLNQASFSFDLSVADMYYALCNGHTLMAFGGDAGDDLEEVFGLMSEIDVAVMTPTFMKLLLLNENFDAGNYPRLRCVYFCGEQLEAKTVRKLFRAFPEISIINAYGPTEATSAVCAVSITKEMAEGSGLLPVGELRTGATEIEIEDGEIVLKGESVFAGYLGAQTGGSFIENGRHCFKTGDLGYIEGGRLYCKGRRDSQIKYKGYRIELDDIEYNINLIDGVRECAAVAKYNYNHVVKTIKAFVTLEKPLDPEYIKSELERYLPAYMIPKTIRIVDRLPMNRNGKVDRKALGDL